MSPIIKTIKLKKIILIPIIALAFTSCEKKSSDIVTIDQSTTDSVIVPESSEPMESSTLQNCYLGVSGKDSVFISLDDNLGTITGKMRYKNFEKDSSFGDLIGSKNGDTLKLSYTFQAEGTTSEREIYFLHKGENIIEGIGNQKMDGSKSTYENPSQLKFDGSNLKQVDCTNFEKKFNIK